MTLLDHQRAQERTEAAEAHQKDEKHGLLITKKDANAKPPCPPTKKLRSQAFVLDQMRHSMKFFSPERAIDKTGGYFHFFAEDGSIFSLAFANSASHIVVLRLDRSTQTEP